MAFDDKEPPGPFHSSVTNHALPQAQRSRSGCTRGPWWAVTVPGSISIIRLFSMKHFVPGKHRLERNQGVFFISVSAGSNYFVRAKGYSLEQVSEQMGRARS